MAWNEPGGNGNKDPWGHRKNEQGPPDLEEVLRKLREGINQLLGNKRSPPSSGQESHGGALFGLAIFALIIWGLFGFYIIQPAEQGVETRFGRYTKTTSQGLNWIIPYPIESVQKVNVEQVRAITHKALMLTQDENLVQIELVVQYRIRDAAEYLFNVVDPDDTLRQATESALREIVGGSKMDEVLTSERTRVAADTKERIQLILNRYNAGLSVTSVNMQDAQPPNEVQEAFADVIKAREDEERHKNKAEAYSNEITQRAGGNSDRLRQEAQAYKAQVVARAEGETQRFISILNEYEKAPDITRKRLYLEAMESVLSKTSKIVLDVKQNNNLLVLPLDRFIEGFASTPTEKSVQPDVLPPLTPPALPSQPPAENERRSREDARTRGSR